MTIFTVLALILATGGFSVYQHICHCVGEMSVSVFTEATCDHDHGSQACCSSHESSSCCSGQSGSESRHACHDKDCCQNSSQFLKISDSFQPGLEKISLKPALVALAILPVRLEEAVYRIPYLNIYSSDLPPPDEGRQKLVALHQLKLDPAQV